MTSPFFAVLMRRALAARDPSLLQTVFDAAVLDRYRGNAHYSVIRTDTVGRVRKQGGWSLDFGIVPGDAQVHASWAALASILPDDEREHWAAHAASPWLSEMFLKMQLAPGSCFDDGELREWGEPPQQPATND